MRSHKIHLVIYLAKNDKINDKIKMASKGWHYEVSVEPILTPETFNQIIAKKEVFGSVRGQFKMSDDFETSPDDGARRQKVLGLTELRSEETT